MHRFFVEDIQANPIELDPEESRHLSKVLRLTDGDEVELFDGNGSLFRGKVLEAHAKRAKLAVREKIKQSQENYGVQIAAAPTKNMNRWELFLEKATEIGIDRISPLLSEHSERKVLKRDRQERILKSAVKQSHKLQFPQLDEMISFSEFIKQDFEAEKYIAHCHELPKMKLSAIHPKGKPAVVLIGPEGDFSPAEIKHATACGFKPVSISGSRLRTETAALVALHTIHLINA